MKIPAGVKVVHTHDGVRVALDGRRRGDAAVAISSGAAAGLLFHSLVGADFLFPVMLAAFALTTLVVSMVWPVQHSVIELHPQGGRVFVGGRWSRFRSSEIRDVDVLDGAVLQLELADRSLRVPVGHSVLAARWIRTVLLGSARDASEVSEIPASLLRLSRSARSSGP